MKKRIDKKSKAWKRRFLVAFAIIALTACEETDRPEKETGKKGSVIEQKIDLSNITSPPEVSVYKVRYWKGDKKTILSLFLDGNYDQREVYIPGENYVSGEGSEQEKTLNIYDGGRAYYRKYGKKEETLDAGIGFGYRNIRLSDLFPEYNRLRDQYYQTGSMDRQNREKEDSVFTQAEEVVKDYCKKLDMAYTVDDAALLTGKNGESGCLIFWRQEIDGIPLSSVILDKFGSMQGTTVYNSGLDYQEPMGQPDSVLETTFVDRTLVDWSCADVIQIQKELKKYPAVSVSEAWKKVKERYEKSASQNPSLETAKLQYKLIELSGTIITCPVWTFCVRTETKQPVGSEILWNYYLVDALTGDFFTGTDMEGWE